MDAYTTTQVFCSIVLVFVGIITYIELENAGRRR